MRQENTIYDGRYQIPTFQQVIDLAKLESRRYGRQIGIAPETKHPTYFDSIGLSLEEPLVATLRANGLDTRRSAVYLQSFEESNLRELHYRFHLKVNLLQLTSSGPTARPYDHVASGDPETYAEMTTAVGLKEISTYADVLGPDKAQIFPRDAAGNTGAPTSLVTDAHHAGLKVVPYTFRAENQFLPTQYRQGTDPNAFGNVFAEFQDLYRRRRRRALRRPGGPGLRRTRGLPRSPLRHRPPAGEGGIAERSNMQRRRCRRTQATPPKYFLRTGSGGGADPATADVA